MDNDDLPVGRILSRREVLGLLGATGTVIFAGGMPRLALAQTSSATEATTNATMPACIVTPELTEGPYYLDLNLNRSDIHADSATGEIKEGVPLALTLRVFQIGNGCEPLEGATVEVWHCDALGRYSGVQDPGFDTSGEDWLRGYQVTDENGEVQFLTIYPGWYQGRAVHIHFKVRADNISGESTAEFTSQFFFDEAVTDEVHAQEPYASKGYRTLKNDGDGIFQNGGEQLLLSPTETDEGYTAKFDIGLYTA